MFCGVVVCCFFFFSSEETERKFCSLKVALSKILVIMRKKNLANESWLL